MSISTASGHQKSTKRNFPLCSHRTQGKKGDTLNMTVVSVTRPDFQPDMKETSSYGWYHQSFERVLKLHFNEDAPENDSIYGESITAFRDVSISEEKSHFLFY